MTVSRPQPSSPYRTSKLLNDAAAPLMNTPVRVYTNPDVVGCELSDAVKNVIALAAGMADGLGFGDNTKAALITHSLFPRSPASAHGSGRQPVDVPRPRRERRPGRHLCEPPPAETTMSASSWDEAGRWMRSCRR